MRKKDMSSLSCDFRWHKKPSDQRRDVFSKKRGEVYRERSVRGDSCLYMYPRTDITSSIDPF
jgi:hypothetical protein